MREIEAFLAVAEELHFGRAAERLRLSTSRVSTLVRAVERRVGTALFERTSRVVRLTPAGEQLCAELRVAYFQIERALSDVRRAAVLSGDVLRVGFSTTLPAGMSADIVADFEERHRNCRVVASELPTTDLFHWLGKDWPVDVFVTWMPVDTAPIEPPLRIGPIVRRVPRAVLLSESHALADLPTIDIEALAGHAVVYPELPSWFGELWAPSVTPSGARLQLHRLPARYVEDVLRLVAGGDMAHLTFTSLLSVYRRPGVVIVPLSGLPPMPVRPVWADGPNSRWAGRFAQCARAFADASGWLDDLA